MRTLFVLVTLMTAFLAQAVMPPLCAAGMVEHSCECPAERCSHEETCPSDPCSTSTAILSSVSVSHADPVLVIAPLPAVLPLLTALREAPARNEDTGTARSPSELPFLRRSFQASGLPLLI